MEHPTINDLPNELLEIIFDHLDVDDLKHASAVCKRWSDLAFLGARMNRVLLVATFPWDKDLLLSNRQYRHLQLDETGKDFAHVKELFEAFNVSSLRIGDSGLSYSSLRLILREVPDLQNLSIVHEPIRPYEMIEPLPVMRKLEHLEIEYNNPESAIHWHTIAPSLQGLKMRCDSEDQLEQWKLFSGQLKQIDATFRVADLLKSFCQITFTLLEELTIRSSAGCGALMDVSYELFRRNTSLRRLCLDGIYPFKTLIQDITNHNQKLTSLEIIDINHERYGEQGCLESLAHLTELKHLRLEHQATRVFLGCKALTSLQSLRIDGTKFGHEGPLGFLKDLLKIAPQLRCLELGSVVMPARAVHFICKHFTKLTRLQLTYSEVISRADLSEIDRLLHLCYLELNLIDANKLFISIIPVKNKVRYLTLHLDYKYKEDDLLRLPEMFPQLDRLNLVNSRKLLRESTVDRLRQLLPTCAIKI